MALIAFSKLFQQMSIAELIDEAKRLGIDGYDLCVRPGYPVSPDNVQKGLPDAVRQFRDAGLDVPMVTAAGNVREADNEAAEQLLCAMDSADVRILKLGYFTIDPHTQSYWEQVDHVRRHLRGWESLARRYHVKVCYHTHSNGCMGLNGAALCHLIRGFDPDCIGAYLDAGHLVVEGEAFALAVAMVGEYLTAVSLKDVLRKRVEANGHGKVENHWVPVGAGMVDWTHVFETLQAVDFTGPLSVHCEFKVPEREFASTAKAEVAFFRRFVS